MGNAVRCSGGQHREGKAAAVSRAREGVEMISRAGWRFRVAAAVVLTVLVRGHVRGESPIPSGPIGTGIGVHAVLLAMLLALTALFGSVAYLHAARAAVGADAPRPPVPSVITISPGDRGVILLEWTGGPEDATRWQYRQQSTWNDWVWTAWADVPKSDASTRSHRVTWLEDDREYYFQVRAVVGTVMGDPSEEARGSTPRVDSHGIPGMSSYQIIEGGREWRVDGLVIDVPSGTRLRSTLRLSIIGIAEGRDIVTVYDVESGSWFNIDIGTGEVLEREIVTPYWAPVVWGVRHTPRDVGALFDKIEASARVLPPTSN